MHLARIGGFVLRVGVGGVVAAVAAVSMQGAAGAASPKAKVATPTWDHYFYPLKVGWTCHESLDTRGITGSETLQVTSVTPVPGGRAVTIDEGSATTVNGTTVPTNASHHYILEKSGQLVSEAGAGQVAGQTFQEQGNTTYPTVRELLSGGKSESYLRLSVTLPQTALSQLQGALTPGSNGVEATIGVGQKGSSDSTLTVPIGTFHDVLVVHSNLNSIKVTNAVKAAAGVLDSQLRPILSKDLNVTIWYAPGVGPVKFLVNGVSGAMTNCGPGTP
jgi:hypothetical protein